MTDAYPEEAAQHIIDIEQGKFDEYLKLWWADAVENWGKPPLLIRLYWEWDMPISWNMPLND